MIPGPVFRAGRRSGVITHRPWAASEQAGWRWGGGDFGTQCPGVEDGLLGAAGQLPRWLPGHGPAPGSASRLPGLLGSETRCSQTCSSSDAALPAPILGGGGAETCSLVQEGQNFERTQSRRPPGRPAAGHGKRLARRLLGEQGRSKWGAPGCGCCLCTLGNGGGSDTPGTLVSSESKGQVRTHWSEVGEVRELQGKASWAYSHGPAPTPGASLVLICKMDLIPVPPLGFR